MKTVNVGPTSNPYLMQGSSPLSINGTVVWLLVVPSGDLQVVLWMFLCRKRVPQTIQLLFKQKSTRRSPLSFITPQACFPTTLSLLELSETTYAFTSPIINNKSCCGTLETTCCSSSYESSFSSLSASFVGA